MISIDEKWSYYANYVRHPQDKFTTFMVGVKNKDTGLYTNYSIFSFGKHEIEDGDKVQITKIISTELDPFVKKDGTQNIKATVEFKVIEKGSKQVQQPEQAQTQTQVNNEPALDITNYDLPF